MLKLSFVNGNEYEYTNALAIERKYIGDVRRASLEVTFASLVGIGDILGELNIDGNTDVITLTNTETGDVSTYNDYTYIHFAGLRDGTVVIDLCTDDVSEHIVNIITKGEE